MYPFTQFSSGDRRWRGLKLSALGVALAANFCCPPPALCLDINLVEAPANTTLEPTYDPNLIQLGNIMQAAADYWESIILDNHQVTVTYGYVDLPPATHGIAQVTGDDGQRATTGNIAFDIETNSAGDWFFDPTPTNHSEFSMHQVLHRDLAPAAQGLYYDGSPHDVLEVGYWGNYVGADQGRDALTTAAHELGHILGLSQSLPDFPAETGDGDYDFNIFYTQTNAYAVNYAGPAPAERDHVRASDATMAVGAGFGDRNLPGVTDVFAAASVSGWFLVDVPRKDFWGNGATNWNNSLNWPGNRQPDAQDEVYVRNDSDAMLTIADGLANNLFIAESSSVSTGTNAVRVSDKITIEGVDPGSQANLVVNAGGRVTADEIELNEGGLLTATAGVAAGFIEVDVVQVDINEGGVLLGNGDIRFSSLLRNDGAITAISGAGDRLSLLQGTLDLDGLSGDGEVFAVLGDLRVSAPLSDGFDGQMTIGEGREIEFFGSWDLGQLGSSGGQLVLDGGAATPATLTTNIGLTTFVHGEVDVSGQAEFNARTAFESGVTTDIEANGQLALNDTTTLRGGVFQGDGTLRFNGTVDVDEPTTLGSRYVDLDGLSGNTELNINSSALTLDVDRVESAVNNRFDGTLNVSGLNGSLAVNLNDPQASWQMDGVLAGGAAGILYQSTLTGSPVEVTGTMNISGLSDISAPMDLSGSMNLANILTVARLSDGPNVIRSGASLHGAGRLRVNSSARLFVEDGAVIDVDVNNQGRLEPGDVTGVTGTATVSQGFDQSPTGTLAMELAGTPGSGNFDILHVGQVADVDGELEVTAINGFVPTEGNSYTLVTASSVVDTFDSLTLLSDSIFKFDASLVYPGTRVVLRIDDVFMFGDFDDDMTLDCADVDALVAEIASGGMATAFDLNGDAVVDMADLDLWLAEAGNFNVGGAYLPGDANLDGVVDISDFNVWNGTKFTGDNGWCGADFNADGVTDISDFNIWNATKFTSSTLAAVPEPEAQLVWCVLAGMMLIVGRGSIR